MDPPPPHIIPGPAGDAQSAMRRHHTGKSSCLSGTPPPQSTQEAIRRKLEEPVEDEDFQGKAWLSAMDYLTAEGTYYPLRMIKEKCQKYERVEQVVVFVKECTPSGHGSMHLILKDPTDTIDAYIADKVLKESESGSDIGVGAVLIFTQFVFSFAKSGRPRSRRFRNSMDFQADKRKTLCSSCHQEGHNRRRCPNIRE